MFFPKDKTHKGEPDLYLAGDTLIVECEAIGDNICHGEIKAGLKGRLWECGYCADIEIISVNKEYLSRKIID